MQLKQQQKICAVYGEGAMTDQTRQKCLAKFCAGEFLLCNAPWLDRPVEVDSSQIKTLRTINALPHRRQPTYSKYPNQ